MDFEPFGAYSYLGKENRDQYWLNACLNLRIAHDYELLDINSGLAIFKRKTAE